MRTGRRKDMSRMRRRRKGDLRASLWPMPRAARYCDTAAGGGYPGAARKSVAAGEEAADTGHTLDSRSAAPESKWNGDGLLSRTVPSAAPPADSRRTRLRWDHTAVPMMNANRATAGRADQHSSGDDYTDFPRRGEVALRLRVIGAGEAIQWTRMDAQKTHAPFCGMGDDVHWRSAGQAGPRQPRAKYCDPCGRARAAPVVPATELMVSGSFNFAKPASCDRWRRSEACKPAVNVSEPLSFLTPHQTHSPERLCAVLAQSNFLTAVSFKFWLLQDEDDTHRRRPIVGDLFGATSFPAHPFPHHHRLSPACPRFTPPPQRRRYTLAVATHPPAQDASTGARLHRPRRLVTNLSTGILSCLPPFVSRRQIGHRSTALVAVVQDHDGLLDLPSPNGTALWVLQRGSAFDAATTSRRAPGLFAPAACRRSRAHRLPLSLSGAIHVRRARRPVASARHTQDHRLLTPPTDGDVSSRGLHPLPRGDTREAER
ncbi:hypothetical protein GGX14DRAFT_587701 [Mycena pura]|uniref:Uncharacterized protein n=1 Tax=Mycena pura TaxID=153505 RepID=A0AAD6UWJ1_9AGAR|nr:hypothetical protein GGX14DRAFT_587701 [Mycena pura]